MVNQGPGPRDDGGGWCCMCGVWKTEQNRLERCPVSHAQMRALSGSPSGLTHLWAFGIHDRAMKIWEQDAPIRQRLAHDPI